MDNIWKNGILLPKLFWPTLRKNGSNVGEKLLKFKTEGIGKKVETPEQFIQTVKVQNNLR